MECQEVEPGSPAKRDYEHSTNQRDMKQPEKECSVPMSHDEETDEVSLASMDYEVNKPDVVSEVKVPVKRGRRRRIYNQDDSPEIIKEKQKKRAVELKLSKLKWTLNQERDVSGKRHIKAPQRFELIPVDKRKSCVDDVQGHGMQLGSIAWIYQHLQSASLYTLRLLHRTIYRKQGMFSEKHIRKSVIKFSGFPFDGTHEEMRKRREQLERTNVSALGNLCDLLAIRRSNKDNMIDRIIGFLLCPNQKSVDDFLQSMMAERLVQSCNTAKSSSPVAAQRNPVKQSPPLDFLWNQKDKYAIEGLCSTSSQGASETVPPGLNDASWKKPIFFAEGNGVKLKYIRAVAANIQMVTDSFIELLHRLLYLNVDEQSNMRRSILEFSGLDCDPGSHNYIYRLRILAILPVEQVKLICRVLCLPTWHRSRQLLTDGIMDFLAAPRISAMKKRIPPHFSDEITFSFDTAKVKKAVMPELKSDESEEIEIFPDIHISEEGSPNVDCEFSIENEYLGVKLKNFSNILYQVISTPAVQLNDVHMILYLSISPQNNIRKSILEFSGFPFDESTPEFKCRRDLMKQMGLTELKAVATVLCVSQYIVDETKESLIDAILKFLLKPSALLNSSTIMPTISPAPSPRRSNVVKKKATSTSKTPPPNKALPEIVISEIKSLADIKTEPAYSSNDDISSSNVTIKQEVKEEMTKFTPEIEKMKACLSSDIQIMPVPSTNVKKEETLEPDVPLSNMLNAVSILPPSRVTYFESDDEDDKPLSKMIGHPNDDQLRQLVTKIVKESKLEDVTMKTVIKKVFDNYPNYDLGYRKEFIKSIVRQILSQMEDQTCSVTTTVITI